MRSLALLMPFAPIDDAASVENIYMLKTGKLLQASILAPTFFKGISDMDFFALKNFSESIGIAFQIQDDFLDAFGEYGAPEEVTNTFFLKELSRCLNPGGWLVGNLWTVLGDFFDRRRLWQSTFNQLLQARANEKGNIILYASQDSKETEIKNLRQISKNLQKHHQLDFQKMLRKIEAF